MSKIFRQVWYVDEPVLVLLRYFLYRMPRELTVIILKPMIKTYIKENDVINPNYIPSGWKEGKLNDVFNVCACLTCNNDERDLFMAKKWFCDNNRRIIHGACEWLIKTDEPSPSIKIGACYSEKVTLLKKYFKCITSDIIKLIPRLNEESAEVLILCEIIALKEKERQTMKKDKYKEGRQFPSPILILQSNDVLWVCIWKRKDRCVWEESDI